MQLSLKTTLATLLSIFALVPLVIGEDTEEARLADSYGRLCAVAAPYGMTVDLEFLPWSTVPDASTAMRVVQRAGAPANAGILVDAVSDILTVNKADIQSVPEVERQGRDAMVRDVILVDKRLVGVLSLERLIAQSQLELTDTVA